MAIEQDEQIHHRESEFWLSHNVDSMRVFSMDEGIEKAAANEFLYIGINASNIEYAPKLELLRAVTIVPILIATNFYTVQEQWQAIALGADLFGQISDEATENHKLVMAAINRLNERAKQLKNFVSPMTYGNIMVIPAQRRVFINNEEVELTKTDWAILYCLIINRGNVLTFKQIYRHVWGSRYDESANGIVKSAVKRLRKKIDGENTADSLIKNIWGVGYILS